MTITKTADGWLGFCPLLYSKGSLQTRNNGGICCQFSILTFGAFYVTACLSSEIVLSIPTNSDCINLMLQRIYLAYIATSFYFMNFIWVLQLLLQVYCWKGLRFSARQDLEGFSRVCLFMAKIWVSKSSVKNSIWNLVNYFLCSSLNMALKVWFLWNFCHLMRGPNIKLNLVIGPSVPRKKRQKVLCSNWKNLRYLKYFRSLIFLQSDILLCSKVTAVVVQQMLVSQNGLQESCSRKPKFF